MYHEQQAARVLSEQELYSVLWESGELSLLMHAGQRRLDEQFHTWRLIDQIEQVHETGSIPLVFAVKGGKRFGKTSWALWTAHKLGIWYARTFGRPCSMRYTSAFQVNIDEIIGKVLPQCFRTAPPSCEPQYHGKRGIKPAGLWWPTQGPTLGANLALSGLDQNPNALRGQSNDFDFVSEAAYVDKLDYTVRNVLIHQYQQRPWARMVIETSAPDILGTDWEMIILPDAEARGACFGATIDDNPLLSDRERAMYISMAGGRGHPNCEREYYNVIQASPEQQVIPEFNLDRHVVDFERPEHACAIMAGDPGMRDLFGLGWGYWDAKRAKLCVERDWAKRNASTGEVAGVIASTEQELYGAASELLLWETRTENDNWRPQRTFGLSRPSGFSYWDGSQFRPNPVLRVSDTEARLIGDLIVDYKIGVMNTLKDDKEAALYALRNAFRDDKIEIHPRCVKLIKHVRTARWNENRTDYERTSEFGHFDLLDMLVYMWRMVQSLRARDPFPPEHRDPADLGILQLHKQQAVSHDVKRLRAAFGGGRRSAWR